MLSNSSSVTFSSSFNSKIPAHATRISTLPNFWIVVSISVVIPDIDPALALTAIACSEPICLTTSSAAASLPA